jgi:hypothetical protein
MITEKQLEANRKNSKLGGVKTEAGKEISRMNAVRHGVFRQILTDYESEEIEETLVALKKEFHPQTFEENFSLGVVAESYVRYQRIRKAEQEFVLKKLDPSIKERKLVDKGWNSMSGDPVYEEVTVHEGYTPKLYANDAGTLCDTFLRYSVTARNALEKDLDKLKEIINKNKKR